MTSQVFSVSNKIGSIYVTIVYSNKTKWKDRFKIIDNLKKVLDNKRLKK